MHQFIRDQTVVRPVLFFYGGTNDCEEDDELLELLELSADYELKEDSDDSDDELELLFTDESDDDVESVCEDVLTSSSGCRTIVAANASAPAVFWNVR